MFRFIRSKIRNKKWLNASLFTGVALLIAFLGIYPMFLQGSLDRLLRDMLEERIVSQEEYPMVLYRRSSVKAEAYDTAEVLIDGMNQFGTYWESYLGVPMLESEILIDLASGYIEPEYSISGKRMNVGYIDGLEEHAVLVDGSFESTEEAFYPCVLSKKAADMYDLVVGEHLSLAIDEEGMEQTLYFVVTGIVDEKEGDSVFWYMGLDKMEKQLLVSKETLTKIIEENATGDAFYYAYAMYDYTKVNRGNAERIGDVLTQFHQLDASFVDNISQTLNRYYAQKKTSQIMLFTFELPIVCLLLLFLYMISGQILQMEANEIAMLKSRGVKKGQIVRLYGLQSFVIALGSMLPGIPLSYVLCKLAASTNSFLEFTTKDTHLYRFVWEVFPFAGAAVVLGVIFMTIPVIKLAGFNIVNQKSKGKIQKEKPLWERYYLDLALLLVSGYLLYTYYGQQDALAQKVLNGQTIDPVIFINSSAFLLGGGLFTLRLIHLLVRGIYRLGRKKWKPAGYVAFLQIIRSTKKQGFISVFLVVTISMGIFHSNLARSVNENTANRIAYDIGADLKIEESWNLKTFRPSSTEVETRWQYEEPAADRFELFYEYGVTNMTKVLVDKTAAFSVKGQTMTKQILMGIEPKKYGETVTFEDGINETHWYNALNALSQNATGVIISRNLSETCELDIGDTLTVKRYSPVNIREPYASVTLTIVAVVDAFPGYTSPVYGRQSTGEMVATDKYIAIANLATLNQAFKITPYQMWMKLDEAADVDEILTVAGQQGIRIKNVTVKEQEIQDELNASMLQITNGMFSIGFMISLFICGVGFLIYWILTIHERQLLYGIYRAMGMTMKEVSRMLLIEQLFSSLLAVLGGVAIGFVTTALFTGMISIVYLPQVHNIPISIYMEAKDVQKIAGIVIVVFLVCFFVIKRNIKRMNITGALKMGAD